MYALIVTPNPIMRDTLAMVLTSLAQLSVDTADYCPAALALAAEHRPELVIIDGCLPRDEMLSLAWALAELAPAARCAVLLDGHTEDVELRAAGVEVLPVYSQPATELYAALTRLVVQTDAPPHP